MSSSQAGYFLDIESDEIVIDAIDYIIETLIEKIDDNHIATLEVSFTTKIALQKINKIVSLATTPHDGSSHTLKSSSAPTEEFLEFMEPDIEPIPSVIDTWARGVGSISRPEEFETLLCNLISYVMPSIQ